VVEYLGKDYPLYFQDTDEVHKILSDTNRLLDTHNYLKSMDKSKFSKNRFGLSFKNFYTYI